MERLTKKIGDTVVFPPDLIGVTLTPDTDLMHTILTQLAAYEDTGLTPEEIKELLHDTTGPLHHKLGEWIDADASGRLVVLPCKVGDTVYLLFAGNPNNPVISTLKINTVSDAVNLIGKMGMRKYIGRFLSREEAEKALEAMKDGD